MVGTNDGEAIVESCLDGTLACPSVLEEYESGRTGIVGNDVTFTGPWVRIPPPPLHGFPTLLEVSRSVGKSVVLGLNGSE